MKLKKTSLKEISACMAVVAILAAGVLLPQSASTASANSAQRYFRGADAYGAAYKGDSCPFVVEKENLTFNLNEFPSNYYSDKASFLAYSGSVTAEYTFYNPSEYTVTANLAFPFGETPDYGYYYDENGKRIYGVDAEKYDVLVGGEKVDKKVRYTYFNGGYFNVEEDLPKISDEYIRGKFFSPETVVTEYTYVVGGKNKDGLIDESKYPSACMSFDYAGDEEKTQIIFPKQSGYRWLKNKKARVDAWAKNGDEVKLYAFGKPLDTPISFKCYKDGSTKDGDEISGKVELTDTVTTNLKDLINSVCGKKSGMPFISEIDLYNASVYSLYRRGNYDYGIMPNYRSIFSDDFETCLMRWYEYEITLGPNERKTNSVTAPIYPTIHTEFSPAKNVYTYYLSPAKTWTSFGSIDITINTPYYIMNPSLSGFEKTDGGYKLSLSGLPDEELKFTLSSSENPKIAKRKASGIAILLTTACVLLGVVPVVLLAVIIIIVIWQNRKNAKSE